MGTTSRTISGSDTNAVAITMPGRAKMMSMPWPLNQLPMRGLAAVDEDQRQADHHRRHGQRQVDQLVDDALAAEVVAHEQERRDHAEDRVQHDRAAGDDERHLEGVQGARRW